MNLILLVIMLNNKKVNLYDIESEFINDCYSWAIKMWNIKWNKWFSRITLRRKKSTNFSYFYI